MFSSLSCHTRWFSSLRHIRQLICHMSNIALIAPHSAIHFAALRFDTLLLLHISHYYYTYTDVISRHYAAIAISLPYIIHIMYERWGLLSVRYSHYWRAVHRDKLGSYVIAYYAVITAITTPLRYILRHCCYAISLPAIHIFIRDTPLLLLRCFDVTLIVLCYATFSALAAIITPAYDTPPLLFIMMMPVISAYAWLLMLIDIYTLLPPHCLLRHLRHAAFIDTPAVTTEMNIYLTWYGIWLPGIRWRDGRAWAYEMRELFSRFPLLFFLAICWLRHYFITPDTAKRWHTPLRYIIAMMPLRYAATAPHTHW